MPMSVVLAKLNFFFSYLIQVVFSNKTVSILDLLIGPSNCSTQVYLFFFSFELKCLG